ncbi:unnamed protein product [Hymenolepis diminuta]|uniref:DFRP_C domain-containing protein n=1 Tax=Hymenolepis diminuta TaxID=6216 RepID=A0A0R3SIZ2_HYMDI|nr:unnamed protein product [Hymenolepis diminuta]
MNQTKVTPETFLAWKKRKRAEKIAAGELEKKKKQSNFAQGRLIGISGREMFEFNPDFVNEGEEIDGDVADSRLREQDENEEEFEVHDIDINAFAVDIADNIEAGDSVIATGEQNGEQPGPSKKDTLVIDEDLFNDADLDELEENLEDLELKE